MFNVSAAKKWLASLSAILEDNRDYLTELDSAIGDADHGINICRGFAAVMDSVEKNNPADLSALFKVVSVALIKNTGGASGALYGTFFMKLGAALKGENASPAVFYDAVRAGVAGIMQLGHSTPGEKTMLDTFAPVLDAMKAALDSETDFKTFAAALPNIAKEGSDSTIPMLATKGRASYLGERSIGHLDPGSVSAYLIFRALSEAVN
jgi:dihydroxyacetone kinase-like protein